LRVGSVHHTNGFESVPRYFTSVSVPIGKAYCHSKLSRTALSVDLALYSSDVDFMHPFLEPCLIGAIQYLTTQMRTSTPETITPYVEILSSLLSILSPAAQEDDLFSTDTLEPKQSRVLQILAPTILSTVSRLTLDQANPVKPLIDPIVEVLRPYSNHFRPSPPKSRKDLILAMRTSQTRLAQWSAGWSEGFAVPAGVDLRYIGAAVRSCGASVVIRHIVNEMWSAEGAYPFHAGSYL